MNSFFGFPRNTRYTPVPNLFFGPLLEGIQSLAELKCTLRFLWIQNRLKTFPRIVSQRELLQDKSLLTALRDPGEIRRGLQEAVEHGILLKFDSGSGAPVYLLHTETNRAYVEGLPQQSLDPEVPQEAIPPMSMDRPSIFSLYEENIGMLTPLISDELKEAEEAYPWEWIQSAFKEAVSRNRRSWRYIARILDRWETEGREHGKFKRDSTKITAEEYIRQHGVPR